MGYNGTQRWSAIITKVNGGLRYETVIANKFDPLAEDDQNDGKPLTWNDKNDKQAGVDGVMGVSLEYLLDKGHSPQAS